MGSMGREIMMGIMTMQDSLFLFGGTCLARKTVIEEYSVVSIGRDCSGALIRDP